MNNPGKKMLFHTRHLKRYHQIAAVLIRYGFEDVVYSKLSKSNIRENRKQWRIIRKRGLSTAQRIRMALEDLGPAFVKFGQIMSNRPDLVGPEIRAELQKLQQNVKPFSEELAKNTVELELGKNVSKLFKSFTSKPLASASIAQVHEAILHNGKRVVVKVQRPGICDIIKTDTEIMREMAAVSESVYRPLENLNPVRMVDEFDRAIKKETDFVNEANNILRFKANFEKNSHIIVPEVYNDLSTKRVLTMDYIDGFNPTDSDVLQKQGIDSGQMAKIIVEAVLEQIFDHGFFHADPHPGNIRITPDGKVAFLDYGMMGYMIPQWRMNLADLMIAFSKRDSQALTNIILTITGTSQQFEKRDELELEVHELMQQYSYLPLKMLNMGELIQRMFNVIFRYRMSIPSMVYLLARAIITIEGVARSLDPDFNLVEYIRPWAKKMIREKMSMRKMINNTYSSSVEMAALLNELPGELRAIIGQVKGGDLRMNLQHKGLNESSFRFQRSINRLSFAVVLAALIIGSAIVTIANIPPFWHDIPVIGAFGFMASLLLGFFLLVNIARDNRSYKRLK